MNFSSVVRLKLLRPLVIVFYVCAIAQVSLAQEKVRHLFDGHSLNGFQADANHWSVQDGAIVGQIPAGTRLNKNTWLVWQDGELADFELRVQFRLTGAADANSGIQFRCQVDSVDHVSGYQADLDTGATWLGRIYDEHGRALLVERGSRVAIDAAGKRQVQPFAPAQQYAVLFRPQRWNEYRIVAVGRRVDVWINGTLFSQLHDEQTDAADLHGRLAFQLHSGGETKIEFRDIQLEALRHSDSHRLAEFPMPQSFTPSAKPIDGQSPKSADGKTVDLGFESGSLNGWTATGTAFERQPIQSDGIARRWPGQQSGKQGNWFVGGFELSGDAPTGTLLSDPFIVTEPFASFWLAGGKDRSTRVELLLEDNGQPGEIVYEATGEDREQMRQVAVDVSPWQGQAMRVRLVDENSGGWGHLNFDAFQLHREAPVPVTVETAWRSTANPLLQHLMRNTVPETTAANVKPTLEQMWVPKGFSVEAVAAEPDLHQPMAFTFDARGRLWVAEGYCYPTKRPVGEGQDRILIFEDRDHNGTFESRRVFVEGLNLISGLEVGHGGVWIGAAPELLFIADQNQDDVPDAAPKVLLDGFGFADTHETLNSFSWGPDGWLYGNQGVFNSSMIGQPGQPDNQRVHLAAGVWRYHPTRHQFEVFAHGGSNQWGLDYDQHGQFFMTHCRSYWGQGLTTHVIQGGHYWNQVNGGYAPFISSRELAGLPTMKNYLLASARYGHGEGGAGRPGSREVFGGHSHVGTMIYLGDNWPTEYRNHLFTHNLHGHQLNQQVNRREAGGYDTVHAGQDMMFCGDQQYIGVDLQVGPDGAVYISDWYDPRHCHNPNTELWDRGNGRMYRMKYDANYRPAAVDYFVASDDELLRALKHPNDWHARAAQLELAHRFTLGRLQSDTGGKLAAMCLSATTVPHQLRAMWALHASGGLPQDLLMQLTRNRDEYVRAWAIQLGCEQPRADDAWQKRLEEMAADESSLLVRRYLASAATRLAKPTGERIVWTLAAHAGSVQDRDLPLLIWQSLAQVVGDDWSAALSHLDQVQLPMLQDYLLWMAAKSSIAGREALVAKLGTATGDQQRRLVQILDLAVGDLRGLDASAGWNQIAPDLYSAQDSVTRIAAERIGAVFGDQRLFDRQRSVLTNQQATPAARIEALQLLTLDSSPSNLPIYLSLLDSPLSKSILPLLRRFSDLQIANQVIDRIPKWDAATATAAVDLLSSRADWSLRFLDAIKEDRIDKQLLTAFYARQMSSLGNAELNTRIAEQWGSVGQSSEQLRKEINQTASTYKAAPLWAFSAADGKSHFKRLCANCHQPDQPGVEFAPKLEGTSAKGVDYVIENVIDPNAVIGRDYQAWVVLTVDGQAITGLKQSETDSSITLKTATDTITIAKADIEDMKLSDNSFMPAGLLNALNDRERIELIKYVMSL